MKHETSAEIFEFHWLKNWLNYLIFLNLQFLVLRGFVETFIN